MYKHSCSCCPVPFFTIDPKFNCKDCGRETVAKWSKPRRPTGSPFLDFIGASSSSSYSTGWFDSDDGSTKPMTQAEIDEIFRDFEKNQKAWQESWGKANEPLCECGADKVKTSHSFWCPKHAPYK